MKLTLLPIPDSVPGWFIFVKFSNRIKGYYPGDYPDSRQITKIGFDAFSFMGLALTLNNAFLFCRPSSLLSDISAFSKLREKLSTMRCA
ncbi:MAG TPA: hypothetical protein VFG10_03040 [Saprospiraceae bacterium]|nr:hypothetical protein [Saprospiraceae bacterium]